MLGRLFNRFTKLSSPKPLRHQVTLNLARLEERCVPAVLILRQLLLDCLQESAPGGDQQPPVASGLGRLMTLEGWMAEHLHLPLGIDELASQAGLSPRAVQMAFRQHRGVTPLEFLRTLRLDEARKRFSSGSGLSVAEVAGSLGFTHLGRFAGHYRQRFGESPAQTRRKQVGP